MSDISEQNKLEMILENVKKHNLTAYEIGKGTNLSIFAIQKILKGETKNPNSKTINKIVDYLENRILSTNINRNNYVSEPNEIYFVNDNFIRLKMIDEEILQRKKNIQMQTNKNIIELHERMITLLNEEKLLLTKLIEQKH